MDARLLLYRARLMKALKKFAANLVVYLATTRRRKGFQVSSCQFLVLNSKFMTELKKLELVVNVALGSIELPSVQECDATMTHKEKMFGAKNSSTDQPVNFSTLLASYRYNRIHSCGDECGNNSGENSNKQTNANCKSDCASRHKNFEAEHGGKYLCEY